MLGPRDRGLRPAAGGRGGGGAGVCAFLHTLHGKNVVLFGTAGFGLSESYFASLGDRFKAELPADSRVVDAWFCPGKMPPAVRERYEAQLAEQPCPGPTARRC